MPEYREFLPLMALALALTLTACSKKEAAAPESSAAAPSESPMAGGPAAPQPAVSAAATPADAATPAQSTVPPATETAPTPESAPAPAAATQPETPPPATGAPAAATAAAAAPSRPIDGAAIAQGVCMACHQAGMNGAPKFANKVAWTPRIAQGREKLYENAIKGLRGMPARGGNPSLTDDEVKAAVDYMVKVAGGYKE
ncbi:MAG: cytochrome c5 family protein [Gammaproteobacteria bacterium]|nr:cytochrome c5 family protein [Gammaproteobacteria bacterium]